jgi:hypothetical protein
MSKQEVKTRLLVLWFYDGWRFQRWCAKKLYMKSQRSNQNKDLYFHQQLSLISLSKDNLEIMNVIEANVI